VIPLNKLSSVPVYAPYLTPDNVERPSALVDYEMGGIALNDPSQGLQVLIWTVRYDPAIGHVSIFAPGVIETTIFIEFGITSLSLAFDQNMRPFVAFVQNGTAKFFWFDTVLGNTTITELPGDARCPQCCMDDKRDMQSSQGDNDIILAYVRGTGLYYRQQRDRYEIERLLQDPIPGTNLLKVGMNEGRRLQFEFE